MVDASVQVGASLADTWGRYFDQATWRAWVDGFEAVVESEGYPDRGGTLRWRSIPAGRGDVAERVLEHEPRRLHRIAFADVAMEGELETRFQIEGDATRITQRLDYRLLDRGPIARLGALLFVRGQVRASMQRSLESFGRSVEEAVG